MKRLSLSLLSLVSLFGTLALSGCSANFNQISPLTAMTQIGPLKGRVYGGQQPISSAEVFLYATGTAAYSGAANSILQPGGNTVNNGANLYYVPTNSAGEFNISGDYSCIQGTALYLYSIGGNPGAGTNQSAGLMAVLGVCPASGTLAGSIPYIYMNEVSTVAAAYALAPFATSPIAIGIGPRGGSPSPLALQAIANAAGNATLLFQLDGAGDPNQAANATTPGSVVGNVGTVPNKLINSLANVLAACVNSGVPGTGSGGSTPPSSSCSSLFSYTTIGSSVPTDTAQAAIVIAKNPTLNVQNIFSLASPSPVFAPVLSTAPYDFTVAITYTAPNMQNPNDIAIDGVGDAWVTSPVSGTVTMFTPQGVSTKYTVPDANDLAIDSLNLNPPDNNGNVWVTAPDSHTSTTDNFYEIGAASPPPPFTDTFNYTKYGISTPGTAYLHNAQDIVNDGAQYNYVADYTNSRLVQIQQSDPTQGLAFADASLAKPFSYLALDSNDFLWAIDVSPKKLCKIDLSLGLAVGTSGGATCVSPTTQSFQTPARLAIDAAQNPWLADTTQSVVYNVQSGVTALPQTAYGGASNQPAGLVAPFGVAIDGNGTLWITNTGTINFGSPQNGTCTGCSVSAISTVTKTAVTSPSLGTNGTSYYNPHGGYVSGNSANGGAGAVGYKNIAIDGAGDLWITNNSLSSVTEIIGVAAPTITPISYQVAPNPSEIGTLP